MAMKAVLNTTIGTKTAIEFEDFIATNRLRRPETVENAIKEYMKNYRDLKKSKENEKH